MKLHLPVRLFRYVFSCFSLAAVFSLSSGSVTAADTLVLNSESVLSIDYADVSSIFDLSGGILQLSGDTLLNLSNCGVGDGKTYTLLTGVSALRDAEGNAIVLDSSNNAISHYFDTTRPGTGFWADATLALTDDGTLQLVRHHETVKAAQTITTRQTESLVYSYYAGISFEDITQSSSSSSVFGGAIYGDDGSTIELSGNGSVTFCGNTASASSSSSSYSYAYGGAIYGDNYSTISLSNNGSVEFSGNTASYGGGAIYGDNYSTISLSNNGSVTFSGNTAPDYGGAIYGYGSTIELSGNGSVTFSGNSAGYGGAIYGYVNSTIALIGNGSVEFSGNTASSGGGGAIYGRDGSTITLNSNGSVTFSGNSASDYGGAIDGNTIELSGNGSVVFSGNSTSDYGGAIYGYDGSTIELNGNGSVVFSGNTASYGGGAIDGDEDSTIELSGNGSVTFSENTAGSGSAIHSGWCENGGAITLSGNVSVTFSGNTSHGGGAIAAGSDSTITLSGNGSVTFSENTASSDSYAFGGAIDGDSDSTITLSDNVSVTFSGNTARLGGAIHGGTCSTITLNDNESVTFSENTASFTDSYARGGAIHGGTIEMNGNGSVTFSGNTASSTDSYVYGGAIYGDGDITLSGNGSVTFSGNTASSNGGAIYGRDGSTIELSGNGSVEFSGNRASYYGGAISGYGNLNIRNNDSVLFEKNAEVQNETYRLRSIYAGGSGTVISLSAAAGKSIEFRDSVYIASGSTANPNADYTDADGMVHKQTGDIIFTGKYTEQHLNELLAADGLIRTATAEEILNSRTTEVYAMTNLYGGRLRVEDGAVYMGYGITAHEGSSATVLVKGGILNHAGYDLTFNAGTTLELAGENTLYGDVRMLEGSHFSVSIEKPNADYIFGHLQLGGDVSLSLSDSVMGENAILLYVSGGIAGWNEDNITLLSNTVGSDDLTWVGNMLVLNHNADTFNRYFNGEYSTSKQLIGNVGLVCYTGISFENISGGAIYGSSNSTIVLNGNGSVTFSGNTASSTDSNAYGGAIYGGSNSTIELSGNESVEFSGNTVSGSYAYGGAIDGRTIALSGNGSVTFNGNMASWGGAILGLTSDTITLNENDNVTFNGNTASSSTSSAYGGAIYGGDSSIITLSGNGSVTFSGNTASSSTSSAYGGAIYGGKSSAITLSENDSVNFRGNTAENEGGAVYIHETASLMLEGNVEISFIENSASLGSAIYGSSDSTITLNDNGSVTFSGNTASSTDSNAYGGAIYGGSSSTITLSDNGSVTFSGNTASSGGGAIYGSSDSTITLSDNGSVTFSGNTASSSGYNDSTHGGAIYGGKSSTITLSGNESVEFSGNTASSTGRYADAYGGAIYGAAYSTITLSGNGSVTFSGNTASSTDRYADAYGGAIGGYANSTIALSGNGSVEFSGNTASAFSGSYAYGGAIYGGDSSIITLSGNDSVTFSGNTASSSYRSYGGAIYGGSNSTIELSGNGSVTFSGNRASYEGGAISGYGNLNIRNNDTVLFEKNAVISGSRYHLRSIDAGGSGDVISLSAAAGKSIEFRDSVYIASGSTVNLNADYTDAEGVVHKQTGDIIFTGKYTEQHLNELLASDGLSRTATESEILDSRTSVVSSVINLYGGRLRVEDGAVLDCAGLNVAGGESRVSGTGSLVLGGGLSVADGADVILEVATSAAGVTVGDDASLSLRGNFSLTPGAEDSVGSKLITVGRNAELSLTDSSLLGQVALADETSGLYYQNTNGAKLLQFSGALGTGGLNLTTAADGYTVTVSGGTNFAGDITVLDGAVFDFQGNNTTLDATAKISLDSGSTLKLSGSDYAVMSDVLKRATGAGNARLESDAYLSHEDKIQLTGDLIVGSGGRLYLGELPNKVHGGDLYTDNGTAPVAPCTGTLVLDGGSLTFRGSRMELGRVDVTANSSLEIWDQAGSNQKANEYCSIAELNVNASLQLATTWKSKLDIDVLQGSGAVTVGSSKEYREVRVHDLSGYTGVLSAAGDKTTLELNLRDNTTLNAAAQISMDAGSTLKLSGSDYAVMSDALKRATGAGNARLESEAYLSHEDKIQLTGDLIVGSGGRLYLGELPNKVHGGDLYTDNGTAPAAPCTGTLVLDGGSLTFRGSRMELGRVDVTANSSLEIWDQAGSNQKAHEYCSIAELNVNAALQLATAWKSKLDIDVLQGSGAVTVGSSMEYHEVRVHDLSGYTGVLSATGSKTTLELNLVSHSELNADSVQLSNGATATLSGSGTYHLATAKTLADGVSLAEDWSGVVRLSGATLVDDTLSGLSNANSVVELNGVSGYLSRADAQTGAQTYDVNLKLTDNENAAAWNLNNGYNGDKRIFTGEITGTGTLERSSYRGTHQTLVFTGDTSGWTGAINHLPDSATSNGAPISTNVTFSGTQVLNVSTSTNGKGELNVTLDDEHLQAGSKVSVNGAIGANRLTVTEGTTVSLNNEVNVNTLRTAGTAELSADASVRLGGITLSADNPVSALISGVESTGSTMSSLYADAVVKNISIISTVSAYTISSMTLQGVQFATETEQTALTLSGVVFDGTCSFSVGETGQILLDKAILTVLVGTPAGGGNGVLALDYSDLFHCTASGELEITMDKDVEQLLAAGYHTITLDLGDDVNYDNLNLTLNGATYAGNSQGGAQFSFRAVPEPTSATLSLLALAALAARRRRR